MTGPFRIRRRCRRDLAQPAWPYPEIVGILVGRAAENFLIHGLDVSLIGGVIVIEGEEFRRRQTARWDGETVTIIPVRMRKARTRGQKRNLGLLCPAGTTRSYITRLVGIRSQHTLLR